MVNIQTRKFSEFKEGLPDGLLHNRFFPAELNPVTVLEHELLIEALRGDLHPKGLAPKQVLEVVEFADEVCENTLSCGDCDTPERAVNAGLKAAHNLFGELQEVGKQSG